MRKILFSIIAMFGIFSATSCGDMLETDNDSAVTSPGLGNKTDSVFYTLGIAQAMQQLADPYFFIGEMRGDLVTTTEATNNNLRALANYSATTSNAYDSAYVYYKVINNCNYYLANRDTTLYTGAINVTLEEYAAVAAWRAWAYLQLARTYGGNEKGIPFFTHPLTAISQINEGNFPRKTLSEIVAELAPSLARFSGFAVPTFGNYDADGIEIGKTNWGVSKKIKMELIFIPVDVVLGEMYLEAGDYPNAAWYYCKYLCDNEIISDNLASFKYAFDQSTFGAKAPEDMFTNSFNLFSTIYPTIFSNTASPTDVITYIPMSVSSLRGTTTNIPLAFGYDYYSTDQGSRCPRADAVQIAPSSTYRWLTDSCAYYYYPTDFESGNTTRYPVSVSAAKLGDGRAVYSDGRRTRTDDAILNYDATDTTKVYISKARQANIYLFRNTTIYLHLAEALNRMGYPNLAFAILRNGISTYLERLVPDAATDGSVSTADDNATSTASYKYLTVEDINLLKNQIPFLNATNRNIFDHDKYLIYGIHNHGGGTFNSTGSSMGTGIENAVTKRGSAATAVGSEANLLYLPQPIIGEKLTELAKTFPELAIGTTKQDSINAMEDILCDEYAKEFAFEGVRFYDLQRMARHKNESGIYGGNFGSRWFAKKLEGNNPQVSLLEPKNWYLPFE
ncbi:MAG: RagB/SusD family nutrient uptake outer membrane protein [Prevotella sp.]|nr:RagB/SusD family nutrient uptake outer membrane protein [Prevotella sp.]